MPDGKKIPKKKVVLQGPTKKPWGLLAYIAGDNNLSDAGLEDVIELCEVGASDDVHVGVEIDTYGEHTGSLRYEIGPPDWTGKAHRCVIERLSEKDSGDPKTLRSFLKWGFARYPADNHLVVVWNHGAGFRSPKRDIAYDDFGSSLDMPEIENAFKKAGVGPENKIAILGFDACLMNMIEIVHHFKDQVEYVVGSQQTEPGDGWPYDRVLTEIKKKPRKVDLAENIVKVYIKSYRSVGIFNVTQSAIDCSKTEAVIKALSDFGELLVKKVTDQRRGIKIMRLNAQDFEMADYVDLIHMAKSITKHVTGSDVKAASETLVNAAEASILASGTLGRTVRRANGLSVWFPAYDRLYYNYRAKYLALKFAQKHKGWINFLDAYHA